MARTARVHSPTGKIDACRNDAGATMSAEQHVVELVDLATLVDDPGRVAVVPTERIPALLSQLSALQSVMAARLVSATDCLLYTSPSPRD